MRKEKSLKNFISSFIPYIILLFLGFFRINVFLKNLGDEIYALNQVFYQIFVYLSLAEAGAGAYIVQMYYKHFANNNREEIINIFYAAKKLLRTVALIMFGSGLILSFFLGFITKNHLSLLYMQIVFILFLLKNVIDYLMMAPKAVIEADQKLYKINLRYYIMKIVEYIVDIILLYVGFNYIIILVGEIITRFFTYFVTNLKVYREYPWIKNKPKKVVKLKGISNMLWHRISETIHYNTDILLTSSFLSPILVNIYSSYNYITKYLTDIVDMISMAISPSFGNSIYADDKNNMMKIFEEINDSFFFAASFLTISVYILINPFISKVWLSSKYIIDNVSLLFLMINFFIVIARKPLNIFRNTKGLFKETKIIVLLEALSNLVLSFLFVKRYKLVGIIIATSISMITTTLWYFPYLIYKKELNVSPIKYYFKLLLSFIFTFGIMFLLKYLINFVAIKGIITWILYAIIFSIGSLVICIIFYYIVFKNFRSVLDKVYSIIKKIIRKESK